MELFLIKFFPKLPHLIAFIAGFLTFISPCILPLIPAYMSYISGKSADDLKHTKKIHILQKSLLFVCGFSFIFILLGISFNTIFGALFASKITNYIAGLLIIIFGIHFLGLFKISALYAVKKLDLKYSNFSDSFFGRFLNKISAFILGMSFALGWSPCVGPILSSIMILSTTDKMNGFFLMSFYSLGLAIPFLLCALAIERVFNIFNAIKKHARMIEIISGIMLILIGLIIAFGGLDRLNAILQN